MKLLKITFFVSLFLVILLGGLFFGNKFSLGQIGESSYKEIIMGDVNGDRDIFRYTSRILVDKLELASGEVPLEVAGRIRAEAFCLGNNCVNTETGWGTSGGLWSLLGGNVYRETGFVGIGISEPNRKLHIFDDRDNAEINIQSIDGEEEHWGLYVNSGDNSFRLWGQDDHLTILRDGKVGIGNNEPEHTLSVVGDIKSDSFCLNGACVSDWSTVGGSGSNWSVLDNDVYRLNGSVGIGTSSPTSKLHIFNNNSGPIISLSGSDSNFRGLSLRSLANLERWFLGDNNNGDFVIRRNDSIDDLRISSSTGEVIMSTSTANYFCLGTNCITAWPEGDGLWTLNGSTIHPLNLSQGLAIGATSTDSGDIVGIVGNLGVEGNFKTSDFEAYGFGIFSDNIAIGDTSIGSSKLFVRGGAVVGGDAYSNVNMATGTMAIQQGLAIGTSTLDSHLTIKALNNIEGLKIISSNYSPLVISNTANNLDLMRLNEFGNLNIFGSVKIGNNNQVCNQDNAGMIRYDEQTRLSYICNGFKWINQKGCGLVSDQDGNSYETVLIGGQCWMAENLNVGVMLASGSTLPNTGDEVIEKWCYDNDPSNCDIYGGLYSFPEAMRGSTVPGAQGICPDGWRIPSDQDWLILEKHAMHISGGSGVCGLGTGFRCEEAGIVLKSQRTQPESYPRWNTGNNGNNLTSFNVLPAGNRFNFNNTFNNINVQAWFWSSSQGTTRQFNTINGGVSRATNQNINNAYSIRCVRNDKTVNSINLNTFSNPEFHPVFSINKNDNSSVFNGSNLLTILSSNGNVGIGTSSPSKKLTVAGDVSADQFCLGGVCIVEWPSGGGGGVSSVSNSDGTISIPTTTGHVVASLNLSNQNTWTARQTFASTTVLSANAYLGLGTTTPNRHIHIHDTSINPEIKLQGTSGANNHWSMYVHGSNNSFRLWGGENHISVLRDGKVGIGTSSPNSLLHVAGAARAEQFCLGTNCITTWPEGDGLWTLNDSTIHPLNLSQGLAIGATSTDSGDIVGIVGNLGVEGNFKTSDFEAYGFGVFRDNIVIGDASIGSSKLFIRGGAVVGDTYKNVNMATGTMAIENSLSIGTTSTSTTLNLGGIPEVDGIKFPDNSIQTTAASNSVYVGRTTQKYKGSEVQGYEGGNNKCADIYPGSHMCSIQDINNTVNKGLANNISTSASWIAARYYAAPHYHMWEGDVTGVTHPNDCLGFNGDEMLPAPTVSWLYLGNAIAKSGTGDIYSGNLLCLEPKYIACCK